MVSMLVAALGTIVEWYDFSIYFYVATSLTQVFFGGRGDSLLLVLGIGAAGFVFRPLGAVVFGHLGDRVGRKQALVVSAALMAVAMCGVALVPGREVVGVWGGVAMIVLRCLAGFSVGAEYTGIMVFLTESARSARRGVAASWAAANSEVGALLAVGAGALTSNLLSPEAMQHWGWRVLFFFGGLLAAAMVPLRRLLRETETFERLQQGEIQQQTRSPLWHAVVGQPRAVVVAFAISTIGSVSYFLNITYVPTYLEEVVHETDSSSLALGTVAAVVAIVVTPLLGLLSDRFGRRRLLTVLLGVIVLSTIPAFARLAGGGPASALVGAGLLAVPAAGWSAVAAAAVPEQFRAAGRYSGMALGYNLATVLFGGLSPLIATSLLDITGFRLAPAVYATLVALVAGIPALWFLRDMTARPLPEYDTPTTAHAGPEHFDSAVPVTQQPRRF